MATAYQALLMVCGLFMMTSAVSMDKHSQMEYLTKYQYIGDYSPDPLMLQMEGQPDKQFEMAVSHFQRFAGLNVTGEVDDATEEMMRMPRCGVPDMQNMDGIARRRRRRYTLLGSTWKTSRVTYKIVNYTPDLSSAKAKQDLVKSFQYWSDVTPLTFVETNGKADIDILFASGNHGDNSPFDGPGRTLAHAYQPGPGIGGDVHFDDAETYTSGVPQGIQLLQTATHEIGHALGLGHSQDQNAVMAPFYRGFISNLQLHSDDIAGITRLYGRRPPATASTRPPTRPPATAKPPIDADKNVVAFCRNPQINAIEYIGGSIHAFYGDKYLQLDDSGSIRRGYPKFISQTFRNVPSDLDAVLSTESYSNSFVYFFKGRFCYRYDTKKPTADAERLLISRAFSPSLSSVDAAFVWSGNGQIYFIKGNQYFRFYRDRAGRGRTYAPRALSEWKGLPATISDAFRHRKLAKTFFFSERQHYIFNDRQFEVESSADNYDWMHCCTYSVMTLEALMSGCSPLSMSTMALVSLATAVLLLIQRP